MPTTSAKWRGILAKVLNNGRERGEETPMSEELDREKLQLEREKLQAMQFSADRDHTQRAVEQTFREAESRRSRWVNPLVLAVLAAALAGLGNAYVASQNGRTQLEMASQSHTRQQSLEEQKAEYALLLEIMKSADACKAARNLHVAFEAGMLSAPNKREALKVWLTKNADCQNGCAATPIASANPVPPQPTPSPPGPNAAPPIIEQYKTGWMGGGNTQPQQCAIGRGLIAQKHPGKAIQLVKSWEESKRDFVGRVEYQYFCTFQVE